MTIALSPAIAVAGLGGRIFFNCRPPSPEIYTEWLINGTSVNDLQ